MRKERAVQRAKEIERMKLLGLLEEGGGIRTDVISKSKGGGRRRQSSFTSSMTSMNAPELSALQQKEQVAQSI